MESYGFRIDVEGNAIKNIAAIDGALKGLGSSADKAKSSWAGIAQIASGVGLGMGLSQLATWAKDGVSAFVSLGVQMEQTKMSFEVMLGSAERANAMVADLQKMGAATPFTSKELLEGAQMLMNYGVEANQVHDTLSMLGDASQGNSEKFNRMTYAYAQIQAQGRLMGQDLIQLVNAGFNPLQEISKKTGVSMGELKDMMSEGKISAEMVADAFKSVTGEGGRFHDMMQRQSKTIGGLWSTMMDNIQIRAISAFEKIQPFLSKMLTGFINGFDKLATVLTPVWDSVSMIGSAIWGVVSSLGDLFAAITGSKSKLDAFYLVLKTIADVMTIIATAIKTVSDIIKKVIDDIKWLIEAFQGMHTMDISKATRKTLGLDPLEISVKKPSGFSLMPSGAGFMENWYSQSKWSMFSNSNPKTKGSNISQISQDAFNTAKLGGASGGLGQAKVINIHIDTMQKNIVEKGGDVIQKAPMAIDMLTRALNNVSLSQSGTI